MCTESGKRATSSFWIATCSANTTSGSPDSRKSAIHASAVGILPAAASWRSWLSRTSCSARSAAATFASMVRRSSGSVCSQATTSFSASRYSASLDSSTGTVSWRLAGSWGSTCFLVRRT